MGVSAHPCNPNPTTPSGLCLWPLPRRISNMTPLAYLGFSGLVLVTLIILDQPWKPGYWEHGTSDIILAPALWLILLVLWFWRRQRGKDLKTD